MFQLIKGSVLKMLHSIFKLKLGLIKYFLGKYKYPLCNKSIVFFKCGLHISKVINLHYTGQFFFEIDFKID